MVLIKEIINIKRIELDKERNQSHFASIFFLREQFLSATFSNLLLFFVSIPVSIFHHMVVPWWYSCSVKLCRIYLIWWHQMFVLSTFFNL